MHALQQFFAEAINHGVIRTHSLLHDFGRDTDHVRVANVAAFDDSDDVLAGAELAGHWLHAEDAGVGAAERVENLLWSTAERTRSQVLEEKAFTDRAALFESFGEAGCYGCTGTIGD